MWITNGGIADVAVVWAQTDDGIRGFVVPTDTPGFTREGHPPEALAAGVGHLRARPRRRPAARVDAVLPGVTGLRGPLSCLNEARFGILWGVVGAARACLETALDYARRASSSASRSPAFQLTQRSSST